MEQIQLEGVAQSSVDPIGAIELRDYQDDAVNKVRAAFAAGKRRLVLMLSTGAGKTVIAAYMAKAAAEKGKRVCFVCDRIELVDQTSRVFDSYGIEHGVEQGANERISRWQRVQVASIQTLAKRKHLLEPFDLYVYDECHTFYKAHEQLMKDHPTARFLGLSATPWTRGLGKHFEQMVVGPTTSELIERGFLVPFHVYAFKEPVLDGVKVVAGEWQEDQLALACNKQELVADIVQTWLTKGDNRPTILFAVNIAHSEHIAQQFRAAGVTVAHIDCYTDDEKRRETIAAFKRGDIKILTNVGILTKGFDAPMASCLVLARPVRSSFSLYVQMVGRVLRPSEGKQDAIILDHAGNTVRHGFVTEPFPTTLDMGLKSDLKKERPVKEPKKCSACGYLRAPGVHSCPMCGFTPTRQPDTFTKPGELTLLTSTGDKADLWRQIAGWREIYGKSEGHAAHIFKDLTGVWPNHYKGLDPKPPSEWLLKKIKAKQIRYAKGMAKAKERMTA